MDLSNKKITVIGARKSGMAALRLAVTAGARPKVSETVECSSIPQDDAEWIKKNCFAFEFGGHTRKFIEDSDLVVISPAVSIFSDAAAWAYSKGIPVLGEVEFAYQFCRRPVIAVTGTNGKTTVSTLIHYVLQEAGYSSVLCGNIGRPFSLYADKTDVDFFILEVSSFQLESLIGGNPLNNKGILVSRCDNINGFRPYVSVFLNFYKNHLDRHKDMREYFNAKKNIFLNQQSDNFAVLNFMDDVVSRIASNVNATIAYFNIPDKNAGVTLVQDVCSRQSSNYSAVMVVAQILGISADVCKKVFSGFKGIEHRMEWVGCINGVDFINDSKSTTAESAGWALSCLNKPVLMLCGGRDKGANFEAIAGLVAKKVKKMMAFGEARQRLRQVFGDIVDVSLCGSLEDAVLKAKAVAVEGDVVLLSPMCSSFDMFLNFEQRGKVFKELVNNLCILEV